MDYKSSFRGDRVESFLEAMKTYGMPEEWEVAAEMLDVQVMDEVILNVGGAGIDIGRYLPSGVRVYAIELSEDLASDRVTYCAPFARLPFDEGSFDKVIVLALLHHLSPGERVWLYKECMRILKTSGRLVIGDVQKESPQDAWLNQIVDHYNPYGHHGVFLDHEDGELLTSCGFRVVQTTRREYPWRFRNDEEMLDCLQKTFYLVKATQADVLREACQVLRYKKDCCSLDWGLLYFVCTKP